MKSFKQHLNEMEITSFVVGGPGPSTWKKHAAQEHKEKAARSVKGSKTWHRHMARFHKQMATHNMFNGRSTESHHKKAAEHLRKSK